jgi:hypothetical protein
MYYSGKLFTYKLDRTTVTVGAPSMLAMSTSPASVGASSSASAAVGSSAAAVVAGSVLLSTTSACGSTTVVDHCVNCDKSLLWWGLGCGFFQPALPPSPSRLRPLDLWGRKAESPASTRNLVVSIHNIARQVLDYSTREVYLLRRSLGDFQHFGEALACHIVRPPRRCRQTSHQASRRIIDEGHIGQ